jgi:hypothetical protein
MPFESTGTHAQGCDPSGEGDDCSVIVTLDCGRRPYRVIDVRSWEALPAPKLQSEIERAAGEFGVQRPWVFRTGLGWALVDNLQIPVIAPSETGGREVTGNWEKPNIPRTRLINNLVHGLENELLAIPRQWQELIMGLRTFSWDKRKGRNIDYVDALMLAYWSATEGRVNVDEWLTIG